MDFQDRAVVVTGASGVLGRVVAETLAGLGATCHLPVREQAHDARLAWAAGSPRLVVAPGVDGANEDAVRSFYRGLTRVWGSIHCTGGFRMAPIESTSLADFEGLWNTNAVTAFLCSREAAIAMRRGGVGGRIVNVVARPALEPRTGAGMVAYTASKAAVAALTIALGQELAEDRIWVNAVAPSILDTPANRAAMPAAEATAWVKPAAVAAVIAFLASSANDCVRGATVPVYGRA